MKRHLLPLILLLWFPLPGGLADDVVLTGGSRLTGVVLHESDQGLRLLLPRGDEIRLLATDVREVEPDPDAPADGVFMRYREPDESGGGLEIALTFLVHPDGGPRIDLVAAAHIADAAFYAEVQRHLDRVDIVLYEGVKPGEATPEEFQKRATPGVDPIRDLQKKLAGWFGLVFQLDAIDYRRAHFVHADLTAEEFLGRKPGDLEPAPGAGEDADPMEGLPESLKKVLEQVKTVMPFLDAMLSKPSPFRDQMKKMLARIMGNADIQGMISTFMPGLSELLLTKRNAVVMERLQEQREKTDGSIAIFYGAAHMKGIQDLLLAQGYRRVGGRWLRAWGMKALK